MINLMVIKKIDKIKYYLVNIIQILTIKIVQI
jgi:hypothetical protein